MPFFCQYWQFFQSLASRGISAAQTPTLPHSHETHNDSGLAVRIRIPNKRHLLGFRFNRVHLFVFLGVAKCTMDRFDVATHRAPWVANPMHLITVAILPKLNRRSVWESLNNFHSSI